MPKVDIEEVEKQAKVVEDERGIITKKVGDKTYFKGRLLSDWYDSYAECQNDNQKALAKQNFAEQGLDEFGRSKGQVALAARVKELQAEKQKFLEAAAAIDSQIGNLKIEDFENPKA